MRNAGIVIIGAGVICFLGAVGGHGVTPIYAPKDQPGAVVKVDGKDVPVREYTKQEARGREVYVREGCASCHTQMVRTASHEELRWGPAAQAGEYALDRVPTLGERRIGPDLSRIGGRFEDGWHLAHLYDPRLTTPDSVMPGFKWLFATAVIPVDSLAGERRFGELPEAANRLFDAKAADKVAVPADEFGRAFLFGPDGRPAGKLAGKPDLKIPGKPEDFKPKTVTVIAATDDALALVAYLQRLGTDLGDWQEDQRDVRGGSARPANAASLAFGGEVYARRCAGCHGERGDGRGPATVFLRGKPGAFAARDGEGQPGAPTFKFTSTKAGALPTDADLYRTVTRGLRGTAMPGFPSVPEEERWAVIHYVKSFSPSFREFSLRGGKEWKGEAQGPAEPASRDPFATGKDEDVAKAVQIGEEVYHGLAACWTCHRAYVSKEKAAEYLTKFSKQVEWREGADQKAEAKPDPSGVTVAPTDFASDPIKSGATAENLYRVIGMGIAGTEMKPMKGACEEEQLWALAYYVRSLHRKQEKK